MRYLFSIICFLILSGQSFGQDANPAAPTNNVQSDPKKQKAFNKKKQKMLDKEKHDVEQAKKDLMKAQSPAVRKRMRKNLKNANKFNGAKRKGETPY